MELILDSRKQHDFNRCYHELLIRSGLFEVKYQIMPEHSRMLELDRIVYPKGRQHKRGQISFARINGKLIVFDSQFNDGFSYQYLVNGLLNNFYPALYVKYNRNDKIQSVLPCKLFVWVMFPSGFGLVEKFKYDQDNVDSIVMASGMHSIRVMRRQEWFDRAKDFGINTYVAIPQDEYCKHLIKSKWGVILSIRNEKNTREYEFISCNMPLALNYDPYYEFPFNPGEHYFKIENPDSLGLLNSTDVSKYHKASIDLWDNYFRPDKAVKLILDQI
jgi:hypothetical protein